MKLFHKRLKHGFTLIELLAVIAVLGILATIIIPTVGNVQEKARRRAAASNLRQIAIAYSTYANTSGRPRSIAENNIHNWCRILAQHAQLNEPQIYILNEDPLVEAYNRELPKVIATPPTSGSGQWNLHPDFRNAPISFAVANKISSRAPPSTTPIAWTRGLTTSGTWSAPNAASPGVYGSEGGHIVFLDGHVVFYENLTNNGGQLIHYLTKQPTANIQEALSPGAEAFDSTGKVF